jgi:hypothetical protein
MHHTRMTPCHKVELTCDAIWPVFEEVQWQDSVAVGFEARAEDP